jgi:isopenicillin N synthase-like dioxygenase
VNTDPSRSRVSLAFFYEPAFEAVVEPIAGVGGARPDAGQRYPPVRYGSHLESKVLTNFELEDLPSPAAAAATPVTAAVG